MSIDLAEILLTLFWVFFVLLVLYLHRESKREGYPLVSDRSDSITVQGFPAIPEPKEYKLPHGGSYFAPNGEAPETEVAAVPVEPFPGAPLQPTGDPMVDGVGVAAYANRSDTPDRMLDGRIRVAPMRSEPTAHVASGDPDLRGMPVIAADGVEVGKVSDMWIDRAEPQIYYLEVSLSDGQTRMLPFSFADIRKYRNEIRVTALYSHQFGKVPALASADQITLLEEDKITAYYAGGELYADPSRSQPWF